MAAIDELTPKQQKALAALLTEPTITAAAAKVRIGERTIHTWLDEPVFADAYRAARRQAVAQAVTRLQQVSTEAVNVLEAVMRDASAPASTRVTAARAVIETAVRAVELEDLQARVAALEAKGGNGRWPTERWSDG